MELIAIETTRNDDRTRQVVKKIITGTTKMTESKYIQLKDKEGKVLVGVYGNDLRNANDVQKRAGELFDLGAISEREFAYFVNEAGKEFFRTANGVISSSLE